MRLASKVKRQAVRQTGAERQLPLARRRILVADDDTPFARRLCQYLIQQGFDCRVTATVSEAMRVVEAWAPDTVFVDLMLPETNALTLCKFLRGPEKRTKPVIIVISRHALPQGIETMRRAGASHFLEKPFALEEALRLIQPEDEPATPRDATLKELHLLNLFLKQALSGEQDVNAILYNLMRMISLKIHALRSSLIQCLNEDTGLVLASNDDEHVRGLPLQLSGYPEVREVRRTLRPLIIRDVATSDILAPVRAKLAARNFETLAVFPVLRRGRFFGVLSLRMEHKEKPEIFYIEQFGGVCSRIISLAIAAANP